MFGLSSNFKKYGTTRVSALLSSGTYNDFLKNQKDKKRIEEEKEKEELFKKNDESDDNKSDAKTKVVTCGRIRYDVYIVTL